MSSWPANARHWRISRGLLAALAEGEGDSAEIEADGPVFLVRRTGVRLYAGLAPQPPEMFAAWTGLHEGLVAGMDRFTSVTAEDWSTGHVTWRLTTAAA